MSDAALDAKTRAEDILLGALGFGEDARIVSIERTKNGYRGQGVYSDGDKFDFEWEEDLDDLQHWALQILIP